ncbi:anti-sigma-F factor Fin family protein [Alkalihalobacillus sp. MEB130]|uniref:anti-sigma-F factor Fin family protein n=1 Tax=Alkalihalobacillus sp. MEB130 TaxID=2976704 RepID=UPI0028E09A97|nr:anti-sigma-F factor Fin family protein [Alkalihalobacillus sp. MEB130]MDT8862648.1 anti-sigma-F factor Fin family protein [Alkalihalobacillus sp. MEB130]
MAIHYYCRHCKTNMGAIDQQMKSESLGFDHLTNEERTEMVSYQSNGDLHVNAICEDCHEALSRNPDLYQLDHLIQ